ncbi:MAG TPA: hypothetical protein EYM79_11695 [Planctomycetes bacterium]|nr:hypothetical protein [Planctomycetaceae bacterium]HIN54966.1 hypothetical protein [Planctomycetota bacterium]
MPASQQHQHEGPDERAGHVGHVGHDQSEQQGENEQSDQKKILQQLQYLIRDFQPVAVAKSGESSVPTGWEQLDSILPHGGWRSGQLVEWLGEVKGGGVGLLGLWSAWQVAQRGGVLVVLDNTGKFFPPAAAALGIHLSRMLVVSPRGKADFDWTLDQVLRCRAVGAVWVNLLKIDNRAYRRLQLAVEQSGVFGVLVRQQKCLQDPTWAHLRLCVTPLAGQGNWRFRVEVIRAVGGKAGASCELEFMEITNQQRSKRDGALLNPTNGPRLSQITPNDFR